MDEVRLIPTLSRESEPVGAARHEWGEALLKMLGPKADRQTLEEAAALLQERDPELFFEGLLIFAGRQQRRGNLQLTATIYERVGAYSSLPSQNFQPSPSVAERARQGLAALTGSGAFGPRAEFLFSQFTQQATDYRTIVPMIAGSAVFNLTRAATLGRLAGSNAWFSRGIAARFTASLSGFAFEVPTFSLLSRGLMDWSGEPVSWATGAVAKDLAGATLTLGALKSFAFLGGQAYSRIHGFNELGATTRLKVFERFSQAMIPQASAFTGMLLAHHAETELGLRPKIEGASVVTDTLASLLSLGVGAQLGRRALGPGFARGEAELGLRLQSGNTSASLNLRELSPQLAFAEMFQPKTERRPLPLFMSTPGDKGSESQSGEPFYISTGRIRGSSEALDPSTATAMPFRTLVHRNNLYGGRVQALAFQSPGQRFTLGSKPNLSRNYKNLHDSPSGKLDSTLVRNRTGDLHLRQRVEDQSERIPDYLNFFRNEKIQAKQAAVEERNGQLILRNLSRESLVWVMEGSKSQAVEPYQELPLKDGSWIVLGKDPSNLPENTLDPRSHTVLRVELHRPKPLSPDRWNLIEFESLEPAQLEKIPTSEAYLAALLGQSSDFVTWRFRPLFKALEETRWKVPEAKDLLHRIFSESPILAELNIGLLAEVLSSAHRSGWSQHQVRELLFHEALVQKTGMSLLSRLPKLMEESSDLKLNPGELIGLVSRMAKYEDNFLRSLETLPAWLRDWQTSSGEKLPLQELFDFLDRTQVSIEVLRDLFPKIPGGEPSLLETMTRITPELQKQYGYRGSTLVELSAELLSRIVENSPKPLPPPSEWIDGALSSLPTALDRLSGLGFGFLEQRQILFRVAEEQGLNFSGWWRDSAATHSERGSFESYLRAKPSTLPVAGLLTLGLGMLGLHELGGEALQILSPSFMLGASIFFGGARGNRSMSPTFALSERLRAVFSVGADKVE